MGVSHKETGSHCSSSSNLQNNAAIHRTKAFCKVCVLLWSCLWPSPNLNYIEGHQWRSNINEWLSISIFEHLIPSTHQNIKYQSINTVIISFSVISGRIPLPRFYSFFLISRNVHVKWLNSTLLQERTRKADFYYHCESRPFIAHEDRIYYSA